MLSDDAQRLLYYLSRASMHDQMRTMPVAPGAAPAGRALGGAGSVVGALCDGLCIHADDEW